MKTKIEIENKLVNLHYCIDKLSEQETHGFSENKQRIEEIEAYIKMIEWVLGIKCIKNRIMKEEIILTVKDLVMSFLYYDRKDDEELGINEIQTAIKNGVISVDEILTEFSESLKEFIGE